MSVKVYDIGDRVRFKTTFSNAAGVADDPTGIVFKVRKPSGGVSSFTFGTGAEIVRTATGEYHIEIVIDESGDWAGRWEATGAIQAAEEFPFIGRKSVFT